jgi:hypothetical protein
MIDPDAVKDEIMTALDTFDNASPRSQQARNGVLGPSDIGFCRQKAVLVTRGVPPTDAVSHWAAAVGTAVHNYLEAALKTSHPDWYMGSIDHLRVTAVLPSGAEISGHPDIVIPDKNMVLDIKTVNGFEWTKRNGPSTAHKYQRHLYAMGLVRDKVLTDTQDLYVGNIYFDRSGKHTDPLIFIEKFSNDLTAEIDTWVQDVVYAVKNGEDSARDIPAAVCEQICEFFTACRGGLETYDEQEVITDKYLLDSIDMYVEGRDLERQGKQMKSEANEKLTGINGTSKDYQVRWVQVGSSERLDVRKVRK